MSYCVNCGVELDPTARACPLCHTPAVNPNQPVDTALPPPFPSRREEVQPVSKKELALLLSAMMGSVAVCCGLLNLFFLHSSRPWSLYVIGAAAMLWIWLVPPLVLRRMPLWLRLAWAPAPWGCMSTSSPLTCAAWTGIWGWPCPSSSPAGPSSWPWDWS